jgi:uncharacterized protein YhbP (UPF0306 family)
MIDIAGVSGDVEPDAARASMLDILSSTPLCTVATCNRSGVPAASTAFYVLDRDPMVIYILTSPDTVHGGNIMETGLAALNVFSTAQKWSDAKRGVQIETDGKLTPEGDLPRALELYLASYPGLSRWVKEASDIDANLESRFFSLAIRSCKIFDEPNFGSEVWITVDFVRG